MSPARRDYKPGRAQAAPTRGQRGRGATTKPLAAPKTPSPCSDSDCSSSGSFETIGSSVTTITDAALAQLQALAAKADAAAKARPPPAADYFGADETDCFWMDQYWSTKPEVHRRSATLGEVYARRGPRPVDDGAIFDMEL